MIAAEKRTYNLEEVAKLLGIGRSTVYTQARAGLLPFPCIRVGKRYLVPAQAIDRFLGGGQDPRKDER